MGCSGPAVFLRLHHFCIAGRDGIELGLESLYKILLALEAHLMADLGYSEVACAKQLRSALEAHGADQFIWRFAGHHQELLIKRIAADKLVVAELFYREVGI